MAGTKTEMVKQALVRYIADSRMCPGTKLPSQNELRQKLKVGSATVTSAINALAEDNVLEIRDKVGAFIKDTGLDGHTGRNVAILINISNSIYNHIMVSRLQKDLQDENCHNIIFSCPGDKDSKSLKNFPGLLRNLKQKHISALLITCKLLDSEYTFLDRVGIRYVSTIDLPVRRGNCHIDYARYINESFSCLTEQGALRPAIVSRGYEINPLFAGLFSERLTKLQPELDYRDFYIMTHSFTDSKRAVEELLQRKSDERPDALIFTGDVAMQGISVWLHRLQSGVKDKYLPMSTAILNKQNPIMPVLEDLTIFELDIYEQAKVAVEVLLNGIRKKSKISSHMIPARKVSMEEYLANSIAPETIEE
jgi:DNA-binding LacI/PurR family transcriptional regulator